MRNKVLPVGIENFTELRTEEYYYIDKTGFILELLRKTFKVNLITRPRRFGKSLTMSMLSDFLDIQKDSEMVFRGLAVSDDKQICSLWMNQWPVLFLTLKNVEGMDFKNAYGLLKATISDLCKEHAYLSESTKVDGDDREIFLRLKAGKADDSEIRSFLNVFMRMMRAHFGKPVILLIDEYDVPLAKASEYGYYEQMLDVIRSIFGMSLKSNRFLKFAVITGCLRIAKESIFTGTNNFVSDAITGKRFDEYFGFTEAEVSDLLSDMGYTSHADIVKKWYDGYRFGEQQVYCPWDVLQYINDLQDNPEGKPQSYWKNTSHNQIIRSFIDRTDLGIKKKFETLLAGGCVKVSICEDLTYDLLHSSEENLWSILYLTGYLTLGEDIQGEVLRDGQSALKIPNEEIREIFAETVIKWFEDYAKSIDRKELFDSLWEGNTDQVTMKLSDLLFGTISYYDYHENFYHAFLAGIFAGAGYEVDSNHEYGTGRPDIVVTDEAKRRALIIEVKHSGHRDDMKNDCRKAMKQIQVREYAEEFLEGYQEVTCYGVAFYKKRCIAIAEKLKSVTDGTVK